MCERGRVRVCVNEHGCERVRFAALPLQGSISNGNDSLVCILIQHPKTISSDRCTVAAAKIKKTFQTNEAFSMKKILQINFLLRFFPTMDP